MTNIKYGFPQLRHPDNDVEGDAFHDGGGSYNELTLSTPKYDIFNEYAWSFPLTSRVRTIPYFQRYRMPVLGVKRILLFSTRRLILEFFSHRKREIWLYRGIQ